MSSPESLNEAGPSIALQDAAPIGLPSRAAHDPAADPGPAPAPPAAGRQRRLQAARSVGLGVLGFGVLVLAWQLAAAARPALPSPAATFRQLRLDLASPLHDNGPNDKGIFLLLEASLGKVFFGFGVAALVGIPLGFALGAVKGIKRSTNPIVQVLRPVSPLAWYPILLVLFKNATKASVLTIAITALWPTLLNTATGVSGLPQDHRDVARVFRFSRPKYLFRVLLPYSLSSIITGLRLSMGISWMVIVATEMLAGSSGIGFHIWDSYNNNNLAEVVVAIAFIGLLGLCLDQVLIRLVRRFDYSGAR